MAKVKVTMIAFEATSALPDFLLQTGIFKHFKRHKGILKDIKKHKKTRNF